MVLKACSFKRGSKSENSINWGSKNRNKIKKTIYKTNSLSFFLNNILVFNLVNPQISVRY